MNIEIRYDNVLGDILTLLQEALVRYMASQSVDLGKFKQHFLSFIKNMIKIEEQFHISRAKLSKNLTKLQHVCKYQQQQCKFSLQPDSRSHHKKVKSLSKDLSSKFYMNAIDEEDDNFNNFIAPPKIDTRKRSGTAGISRIHSKNAYQSIDLDSESRPYTGKQRYRDDKYGSINLHPNINTVDESQQIIEKKQRHSFYDDLQKEALDSRNDLFSKNVIKLPQKKTNASHRFYKINKYF